jgi:two-component system response regulator RegA
MQSQFNGGERTLLLVEDDPSLATVTEASLARRGFTVQVCRSVAEAKRELAEQGPPRYALVDLRLPDGTGLCVVDAIRRVSKQATIVVLTGFANIATAIEATKLGAADYLCKPVGAEIIAAALEGRRLFDEAEAPAPPSVPKIQHDYIQRVLEQNHSNISATARALGMHRRTLQRKLA